MRISDWSSDVCSSDLFGQLIIGAAGKADQEEVRNHLRSWLVKGFFLAFMLSIVPGNFADMVHLGAEGLFAGPVELARFLISFMFVVDVAFATVGYMLTMKPLDARSEEHTSELQSLMRIS